MNALTAQHIAITAREGLTAQRAALATEIKQLEASVASAQRVLATATPDVSARVLASASASMSRLDDARRRLQIVDATLASDTFAKVEAEAETHVAARPAAATSVMAAAQRRVHAATRIDDAVATIVQAMAEIDAADLEMAAQVEPYVPEDGRRGEVVHMLYNMMPTGRWHRAILNGLAHARLEGLRPSTLDGLAASGVVASQGEQFRKWSAQYMPELGEHEGDS